MGSSNNPRNTPYLPTPSELALLALYPSILLFGALFSLLSPETRAAPYDAVRQAHVQDAALAPSYFARKDNVLNVAFVKRGWAWVTVAFAVFVVSHPGVGGLGARVRAGVRWAVVTAWWVGVTQWCFGPPIIDRGFRWSGGRCEVVEEAVREGGAVGVREVLTAAACKASGGSWRGGHDISGHVFLLVLGSFFLLQEVGWVAVRWARYVGEERSVVMRDGAVKGAGVEAERTERQQEGVVSTVLEALGHGGKLAAVVIGLCGWMLLMTAIYFHTWFEKLTGLLVALAGLFHCEGTRRAFKNGTSQPPPGGPPDDMGSIKIPANLPELVRTAFNRARASGDVHFFPTQVTLVNVNSVPVRLCPSNTMFQLRFSPALANKPSAPQPPAPSTDAVPTLSSPPPKETETKKPTSKPFFDPFDNPPATMLITPLGPSHNLVLNKFAIVPEHFILATRSFKEQTHLLERADLQAAYACIQAYHAHPPTTTTPTDTNPNTNPNTDPNTQGAQKKHTKEERDLYVFFNSGPASGSSQPHRHIQLLPVARMREGLGGDGDTAWEVLAGSLVHEEVRRRVPFTTFVERIGEGVDLMAVYLRLYRRACEAVLGVGEGGGEALGTDGGVEGVQARVDYNLAMTKEVMVIAPRVVEGAGVSVPGEGGARREVGKLALNGTVLAGTALVKTQAEWDALRGEPEQLVEILGRIGVPKVKAPAPA
ncbi:inositol phospholipid synthesis and fat-storage-inducing TM-domain-containing protein [Chaetomium fimeti]|uniref:Acyl-coenzyme A diphosphatase SCS3 n=1 Tax=Chaetomium fimeti TaxID=1854472 RepID=A0AAE0HFA3_9PEZI|nr:inositol phospholipid synthesis and fat-storage-inducing TM-domain-containing protein [Chaetomium fimeti]